MYYSVREIYNKIKSQKECFRNCILSAKEFHLGTRFIFNYCFNRDKYRKQLKNITKGILSQYDAEYTEDICESSSKIVKEKYRIWFMWWQGIESMPSIVAFCYDRLKQCSSEYEVVFICYNNINEYIEIPNIILEKFHQHIISPTVLSDYVRVALLKEYGGLWLDASVYCMHGIEGMENFRFWSPKKSGKRKWVIGLLATNEINNRIFVLMKYYFDKYWENNVVLLDYFFTDYCIKYLYENHADIKKMIDGVEDNNTEIFELLHLLSEPFNRETYEKVSDNHTFQVLSRKKDYRMYKNGKATFGNILLKGDNNI